VKSPATNHVKAALKEKLEEIKRVIGLKVHEAEKLDKQQEEIRRSLTILHEQESEISTAINL
jgi:hypothetical protein